MESSRHGYKNLKTRNFPCYSFRMMILLCIPKTCQTNWPMKMPMRMLMLMNCFQPVFCMKALMCFVLKQNCLCLCGCLRSFRLCWFQCLVLILLPACLQTTVFLIPDHMTRCVHADRNICLNCLLSCLLQCVKDLRGDDVSGGTIRSDGGSGAMGHAIPSNFRSIRPSILHSTMGHKIRCSTMGRSIPRSTKDCNSMNSSMIRNMVRRMSCRTGYNVCSNTMNCPGCMDRNDIRNCSPDPISTSNRGVRLWSLLCLLPSGHIVSGPCSFPES